jgi:hypothetical protein
MPSFGGTIPATVLQRSEIPEGLKNYPVFFMGSQINSYVHTKTLPHIRNTFFSMIYERCTINVSNILNAMSGLSLSV